MSNFEELTESFLLEAEEDCVGLWQIVKHVKEDLSIEGSADVREMTIAVVRKLLESGAQAGDSPYTKGRFMPWREQGATEVIKRIEKEWDALGRDPNIPDIVWFSINKQE